MSVLDTFFFIFDSDASKLNKGLKEADKGNKQLTDGLLKTDEVGKKVGETFVDLIKTGVQAVTAFLAAHAIKEMVDQSAELTNQTRLAAKAAYKGVEDYDAFAKATVAAGGSAEALGSTLKELGMRTQTPINYLLRLSQTFKGLSDQRAMRLASWIGIDPGIVPLLQQGEQGIRNLIKRQLELGIVTKEQADIAKKYKDQLRDTNQVFDDIKRRIATTLLPYLTEFYKIIERTFIWLRDNKQFVLAFFSAVGAIITAIYLPAMVKAVAATMALIGPYLLIAAAVAAVAGVFALAYDDVMNFLHGNQSVIGELAKKWPWIGELVKNIAASVELLWDVIKEFWNFVKDVFTVGFAQAWQNFKDKASNAIDAVGEKFPAFAAIIKALATPIGWVVDFFVDHWDEIKVAVDALGEVLSVFFQLVGSGLQFISDLIVNGPQAAFHALGERTIAILDGIAKKFPWLADAIEAVKKPIMAVADAMGDAFKEFGDIVSKVVEWALKAAGKVMEVVGKIKDFFSDDDDKQKQVTVTGKVAPTDQPAANDDGARLAQAIAGREGTPQRQQELREALDAGKQQMQQTSTPINGLTSGAISNSTQNSSRSTQVTVQNVEVTTQATDPDAVGAAIGTGLVGHINSAIGEFDDGVAA